MSRLHDFSGFEMIDESGAVLAKCASGEDLIKAHVKGYTRSDGTFVAEHDDSRPAASSSGPTKPGKSGGVPLSTLKKHPMWSQSDYDYFKGKGYDHSEIKAFWDRDHGSGKSPVTHEKAPDVVGLLGGKKPTGNDGKKKPKREWYPSMVGP